MHRHQICSFDVFDTVLTRRVGAPRAVFPLVAHALRQSGQLPTAPEAFVAARDVVERELATLRGRPSRLEEIYAEVVTRLSLPPALTPRLVQAELDVERRVCVPVPGIAAVIAEARTASAGHKLIFVSDTPHPEPFITELLTGAGLLADGDRVYASADRGASKSAGGLMTLVAKDIADPLAAFRHVGDNPRSDVAAARAEGWTATHRPHAGLSRYEKTLEEHAVETGGLASWLAGAGRLARLETTAQAAPQAVAEVAAGVTAPLLVGFALWVAGQARQRGLKRLYFVARDGEIMLQVARRVLQVVAPAVECRYLYGSRQAWVLASSALSAESLADWVQVKRDFTARTALARVALTPETVWQKTRLPFADPRRADEPMGEESRRVLAEQLQQPPLVDLVRASARAHAATTIAYLRQEGVADQVPSAVVDVGWNGFTARAFDHLVREAGGSKLPHLFVGLFAAAATARSSDDPPDMTGWLFDHDLRRGHLDPLPGPNVVVEMFCAGTEGRVQRYREESGQVFPQLTQAANTPVLEWGLHHVRNTVARATEHFVAALHADDVHVDLSVPVWRVLSAFWTRPTPDEVAAWGSFPWEEETWPPYYPVAQSLSATDALRRLARGDRRIRRHNSWRAGSAAASPQPWRALLRARAWYEGNGARLRRLPRRIRLTVAARRSE